MKNNTNGSALLLVMCVVFILALAAAFLLRTSSSHMIIAKSQSDGEKAVYVAEAGLERAAAYIASDGTLPAAFNGAIGDGVYCATIIDGATPAAGTYTVAGAININPNNSSDNQFSVTLPGGGTITKAMLVANYSGYNGPASVIHVKPKGNGTQNHIQVNGEVFQLTNANTYDIASSFMTINIYNDRINSQGKAVGHWWVAIATTKSTISVSP